MSYGNLQPLQSRIEDKHETNGCKYNKNYKKKNIVSNDIAQEGI